jgi:hypothetical protein
VIVFLAVFPPALPLKFRNRPSRRPDSPKAIRRALARRCARARLRAHKAHEHRRAPWRAPHSSAEARKGEAGDSCAPWRAPCSSLKKRGVGQVSFCLPDSSKTWGITPPRREPLGHSGLARAQGRCRRRRSDRPRPRPCRYRPSRRRCTGRAPRAGEGRPPMRQDRAEAL